MSEEDPNDVFALTCNEPYESGHFTTIARRSTRAAGRFLGLSPRETEALKIMGTGAQLKEIAKQMQVTERTVETFKRRIFAKLGVNSSVTAVALLAAFCSGADMRRNQSGTIESSSDETEDDDGVDGGR